MDKKGSVKKQSAKKTETEKEHVKTDINSAAILNVLTNCSGHTKNGEIVKLTLVQIQRYLREDFDISIKKIGTIKDNISDLQGLGNKYRNAFPMILCEGKYEEKEDTFEEDLAHGDESLEDKASEEETNKKDSHKVMRYWIPKVNLLDSGEYKILKSKVEADSSLNPSEKASLIRKIDSISSSDYSKELGTLDNTPIFDKASLGDANISKKLDMIGKAIRTEVKIAFFNNIFDVNKNPYKVGDEIVFSPYQITDSKGYIYVIGLKDGDQNASHYRIDKLSDLRILKTTFDGRDKSKNLNRYKESHPFMSKSQSAIKATLKLKGNMTNEQDNIGTVIDTFGYSPVFREINDNDINEYCLVELTATAEAIYKFTLMNSDIVEVVAPEILRNRLRKMSKYSYDSYLSTYEDFYEAEIDKIKEGGLGHTIKREFHCEGVDLSKRTEHHNIPIIRLCLDNNNVEDISFVRNYKDLCSFRTRKNPIVDYTPLCDIDTIQAMQIMDSKFESYDFIKSCKSLRKLTLDNNDVKDKSALYDPLNLDYLVLSDEDEIDVPLFKKNNPLTEVLIGWDKIDDKNYFINPVYPINEKKTDSYQYPLNVFIDLLPPGTRRDSETIARLTERFSNDTQITRDVENLIERVIKRSDVFLSIVKNGKTIKEAAIEHNIRIQDAIELFDEGRFEIRRDKEIRSKYKEFFENRRPGHLRKIDADVKESVRDTKNIKDSSDKISKYELKPRRKRYD